MIKLRDYQQRLFDDMRKAVKENDRVVVVAPTGAGKTITFVHTVSKAAESGSRSIILVHRQELLFQTSETLKKFGVEHGLIAAGHKQNRRALVQVAMVQTLCRRLNKVPHPKLLIIDEAHHAKANSYLSVISEFVTAKVVGFTATPERLDGQGLGDIFNEMIYGPSVKWLMKEGFLSPAKYYSITSGADFSKVRKVRGDFAAKDVEELIESKAIVGDAVREYKRHSMNQPAVAFCVTVAEAHRTAEAFKAAGIPAGVIKGDMSREERSDIVAALGDGRIKVLTSCEVINEGFDLPIITTAILLRPTQSIVIHCQQIGRVLRPFPGKKHAVILDHTGNLLRHGVAELDREWSLEGKKKRQSHADEKDNFIQCPECQCIFDEVEHKGKCPGDSQPERIRDDGTVIAAVKCQWEKPKREVKDREAVSKVDGTLVEFDGSVPERYRTMKPKEAKSRADLAGIAKARGYKKGWVWYTSKEMGFRR